MATTTRQLDRNSVLRNANSARENIRELKNDIRKLEGIVSRAGNIEERIKFWERQMTAGATMSKARKKNIKSGLNDDIQEYERAIKRLPEAKKHLADTERALQMYEELSAAMKQISNVQMWNGKDTGLFTVEIDYDSGFWNIIAYRHNGITYTVEQPKPQVPEVAAIDAVGLEQQTAIEVPQATIKPATHNAPPQPKPQPDITPARVATSGQPDFITSLFQAIKNILGI